MPRSILKVTPECLFRGLFTPVTIYNRVGGAVKRSRHALKVLHLNARLKMEMDTGDPVPMMGTQLSTCL